MLADDETKLINIVLENSFISMIFYILRNYENTWTKEQRSEFGHRFHKILVKCLDISPYEAWHNLQQWSTFGTAFNLDDMSRENFDAYLALVKDLDELEEDED